MADYETLIKDIENDIKQNNNQEITGQLLQDILKDIANTSNNAECEINDRIDDISKNIVFTRVNNNSAIYNNCNNIVSGTNSISIGNSCNISGSNSLASGKETIVEGNNAYAQGVLTQALGNNSHAEGYGTKTVGSNSHSEGFNTLSKGNNSHTEGRHTTTIGNNSHAEGEYTITNNDSEHAQGKYNVSNDGTIHSVGIGTSEDTRKNAHEIMQDGKHYIYGIGGYEGTEINESTKDLSNVIKTIIDNFIDYYTKTDVDTALDLKANAADVYTKNETYTKTDVDTALDLKANAADVYTKNETYTKTDVNTALDLKANADDVYTKNETSNLINDSLPVERSIGVNSCVVKNTYKSNKANVNSFAEGYGTEASGEQSHSEGFETIASGKDSHAEGYNTKAEEHSSHAEGYETISSGWATHTEGRNTCATNHNGEHAEGMYNISHIDTIHSVGIGTSEDTRKNAHEIMQDGKHYIYGIGGYEGTEINESTKDLSTVIKTMQSAINTLPEFSIQIVEALPTEDISNSTIYLVSNTSIGEQNSYIEYIYINESWEKLGEFKTDIDLSGYVTIAKFDEELALKANAADVYTKTNVDAALLLKANNDDVLFIRGEGENSAVLKGVGASASYPGTVSIGWQTQSNNSYSFSEGRETQANGNTSHAEGYLTEAKGDYSHAEGRETQANGNSSHTEGIGTRTINTGEHAQGKYNVSNENITIHSVGIGTSDTDRKNSHEITIDGKHYIYGIGGYEGTTHDNTSDLSTVINNLENRILALENIINTITTTN